MPTLLITGANGQLGRALQTQAQQHFPGWEVVAVDRAQLDITDAAAVAATFAQVKPDYCLNTAAYTAVDKAETEQVQAKAINADAPKLLSKACLSHSAHLIHFSTDYVYAPGLARPLHEDDPTAPAGVYAATKLAGDEAVAGAATVLRTSWVYAREGHNFVNTMLRLGRERDELRVVYDQVGSPTLADDLALASLQLIEQFENGSLSPEQARGIFHYSNEGVCSWYDFALAIFELAGIDCRVSPIESHEYPTPAQRPHYSVLNKSKFKVLTGLDIRHWRTALSEVLSTV